MRCLETIMSHNDAEYMVVVEASLIPGVYETGQEFNTVEIHRYWVFKDDDNCWGTDVTLDMWDILEEDIDKWLEQALED